MPLIWGGTHAIEFILDSSFLAANQWTNETPNSLWTPQITWHWLKRYDQMDLFNKGWEVLDWLATYRGFLALLLVIWSAFLLIVGCRCCSAGTVEYINFLNGKARYAAAASCRSTPFLQLFPWLQGTYLPEKNPTISHPKWRQLSTSETHNGGVPPVSAKAHCTSGTTWFVAPTGSPVVGIWMQLQIASSHKTIG